MRSGAENYAPDFPCVKWHFLPQVGNGELVGTEKKELSADAVTRGGGNQKKASFGHDPVTEKMRRTMVYLATK
jgi:hypothetical protein